MKPARYFRCYASFKRKRNMCNFLVISALNRHPNDTRPAITDSWVIIRHANCPRPEPSHSLYVMLAGFDWWISIRSVDNVYDSRKFWKHFLGCFPKSRVNENGGKTLVIRPLSTRFSFYKLFRMNIDKKCWRSFPISHVKSLLMQNV